MNNKPRYTYIVGERNGGKTLKLKKLQAIKEFEKKYECVWEDNRFYDGEEGEKEKKNG